MHNNIFFLRRKSLPHQRGEDFINGHCIIFSILFCLLMFHESQTWGLMAIENLKIIYYMYINFIQSFSSNYWIKINFDLKWTLSSKMLSCKFLSFLFVFRRAKEYHQDFNLLCTITLTRHHLFWWKVAHLQCAFTL